MLTNTEKKEFIYSLLDRILEDEDDDTIKSEMLGFLLRDVPNGKLYKYRSFNEFAISNLKSGTIHCSRPSCFNDPFDCKVGIDVQSAVSAKFDSDFEDMYLLLERFLDVYDGVMEMDDCSKEERRIFYELLRNKELMSLLSNYRGKELDDEKYGEFVLSNWTVILDLLFLLINNDELKKQKPSIADVCNKILKHFSRNDVASFAEVSDPFEIIAKNLGVYEDADQISLNSNIFRSTEFNRATLANEVEKDFDRINRETKVAIDSQFRVGSLCTDYKNRLMWSHYANSHKGFCIEYDFSGGWGEYEVLLLPVIYSKERVKFPWEVVLAKDTQATCVNNEGALVMIKSLLTKDEIWSYESEWRIISFPNEENDNIKMPPVSCVYIGALCSDENKRCLIDITRKLGIPVKQMSVDRGVYELHAQLISDDL